MCGENITEGAAAVNTKAFCCSTLKMTHYREELRFVNRLDDTKWERLCGRYNI
jgi:hypothetical protein